MAFVLCCLLATAEASAQAPAWSPSVKLTNSSDQPWFGGARSVTATADGRSAIVWSTVLAGTPGDVSMRIMEPDGSLSSRSTLGYPVPQIDGNAAGSMALVRQPFGGGQVSVRRLGPGDTSFGPEVIAKPAEDDVIALDLTLDSAGVARILYLAIDAEESSYSQISSTPAGLGPDVQLQSWTGDERPFIHTRAMSSVGPDSTATNVWGTSDASDGVFARQIDPSGALGVTDTVLTSNEGNGNFDGVEALEVVSGPSGYARVFLLDQSATGAFPDVATIRSSAVGSAAITDVDTSGPPSEVTFVQAVGSPNGNAHVLWTRKDNVGGDWELRTRVIEPDGDQGPIRTLASYANNPGNSVASAAVDGDGVVTVAYTEADAVKAQRLNSDGTLAGGPATLSADGGSPKADADPDGFVTVAWTEQDSNEPNGEFTSVRAARYEPIDIRDPDTEITSGPPRRTTKTKAKFEFRSTESGSTFECAIDDKAPGACTSPVTYRNLKRRKHTIEVWATDAAGNEDASPAKQSWKITR